jgi:hypothetical protein
MALTNAHKQYILGADLIVDFNGQRAKIPDHN